MKRITTFIIFAIVLLSTINKLYGQTIVDTIYYNKEWKRVPKSPFADFYRVVTYYNDTTKQNTFCDYYITGEKQSSLGYFISLGEESDSSSVFVKKDTSYTYYKSGQIEYVNIYDKTGKHTQNLYYDEYGNLRGKTDESGEVVILYRYDDEGTVKDELSEDGEYVHSYYEFTFWDGKTFKFNRKDNSPYDDDARVGIKRYHPINGYKYVFLTFNVEKIINGHYIDPELSNNIENSLREYLTSKGFIVINENQKMSSDNIYTLCCQYDFAINYNGPSQIAISLIDGSRNIWSCLKDGNSLSKWGDMKKGLAKIYKEFDQIDYHFNPQMRIHEKEVSKRKLLPKLLISKWSEERIISYLDKGKISPIEGVYKNYDGGGMYAILKENNKYYGIVIKKEDKNEFFENGDARYEFTPIEGGVYDAIIYLINTKRTGLAALDGRILTISYKIDGTTINDKYLKTYPNSESTIKQTIESSDTPKSSGSGVVIANGIVATNYHVIEDANKIEVALNVNGSPESYTATVLCVDKQNDLALLSIKDEKYQGSNPPPFKIMNSTADVGTSIFTMGYPLSNVLGEEVKVTDGIISSRTGFDGDVTTYQISAAIQPGNSGGALFDKKGNLVGITNAGVQSAQNVGYAIKSTYLLNLIDSAPINITIPKGQDMSRTELPEILKAFTPFVALIKVF